MNQQTLDCTITTGGYRIGIANEFPNIIEATEKQ